MSNARSRPGGREGLPLATMREAPEVISSCSAPKPSLSKVKPPRTCKVRPPARPVRFSIRPSISSGSSRPEVRIAASRLLISRVLTTLRACSRVSASRCGSSTSSKGSGATLRVLMVSCQGLRSTSCAANSTRRSPPNSCGALRVASNCSPVAEAERLEVPAGQPGALIKASPATDHCSNVSKLPWPSNASDSASSHVEARAEWPSSV